MGTVSEDTRVGTTTSASTMKESMIPRRLRNRLSAFRVDTTLGDNESLNKQWYSNGWPRLDFNFHKLPTRYNFDLQVAREELVRIQASHPAHAFPLCSGKTKHSYRGVGLTTLPGGDEYDALIGYKPDGSIVSSEDVLCAASERLPEENRSFVEIDESAFGFPTPALTSFFDSVLDNFLSPLTKVRLLELKPGGVLVSHVDFPYYKFIRVHAVLETNDNVWWEVDGERKQLPADGSFYFMDVGKYHSVWNAGDTSRWVLSVNLAPFHKRLADGSLKPTHPAIPLMSLQDMIQRGYL